MLEDIRARTPSVILACEGDVNLSQVGEVLVDDRPRAFDGRSFDLDPGEHVFRLASGKASENVRRTVVERGKGQRIALHCVARPVTTSAAAPRPIVLTASLGAVAVVGLGMFGYFSIDGLTRRSDLSTCSRRRRGKRLQGRSRSSWLISFVHRDGPKLAAVYEEVGAPRMPLGETTEVHDLCTSRRQQTRCFVAIDGPSSVRGDPMRVAAAASIRVEASAVHIPRIDGGPPMLAIALSEPQSKSNQLRTARSCHPPHTRKRPSPRCGEGLSARATDLRSGQVHFASASALSISFLNF